MGHSGSKTASDAAKSPAEKEAKNGEADATPGTAKPAKPAQSQGRLSWLRQPGRKMTPEEEIEFLLQFIN